MNIRIKVDIFVSKHLICAWTGSKDYLVRLFDSEKGRKKKTSQSSSMACAYFLAFGFLN